MSIRVVWSNLSFNKILRLPYREKVAGDKDESRETNIEVLELSMQEVTVVWNKVIAVKVGGKWVGLEYIVEVVLTRLANGLKGSL